MKKTVYLLMIALFLLVGCSNNNSTTNNTNNIKSSTNNTNDNINNNSSNNKKTAANVETDNSEDENSETGNSENEDAETNNSEDENAETDNSKDEDVKIKKMQANLDVMFTKIHESKRFNGMILIVKNGDTVLNKGYGLADIENKIEFTDKTKFDVASITKQFTAVSILQLEEKGLLTTDDTIDKFFPDFPRGNEITIHQLLTHTSGLPMHPEEFDITYYRPSNSSTDKIIDTTKLEFIYEPDEDFYYSNIGYILLGYIIESITSTELDVYFKKNIFDVADMNNSDFKDEKFNVDNIAVGYDNFNYEKSPVSYYDEFVSTVIGSQSLCTTVEDLYAWNKALFSGKIINKESLKKAHTRYKGGYGYGWFVYKENDKSFLSHSGFTSGYESFMAISPDDDTFVAVMCNVNGSDIETIKYLLSNLVF